MGQWHVNKGHSQWFVNRVAQDDFVLSIKLSHQKNICRCKMVFRAFEYDIPLLPLHSIYSSQTGL